MIVESATTIGVVFETRIRARVIGVLIGIIFITEEAIPEPWLLVNWNRNGQVLNVLFDTI